jgi:hypothetical protein
MYLTKDDLQQLLKKSKITVGPSLLTSCEKIQNETQRLQAIVLEDVMSNIAYQKIEF